MPQDVLFARRIRNGIIHQDIRVIIEPEISLLLQKSVQPAVRITAQQRSVFPHQRTARGIPHQLQRPVVHDSHMVAHVNDTNRHLLRYSVEVVGGRALGPGENRIVVTVAYEPVARLISPFRYRTVVPCIELPPAILHERFHGGHPLRRREVGKLGNRADMTVGVDKAGQHRHTLQVYQFRIGPAAPHQFALAADSHYPAVAHQYGLRLGPSVIDRDDITAVIYRRIRITGKVIPYMLSAGDHRRRQRNQ